MSRDNDMSRPMMLRNLSLKWRGAIALAATVSALAGGAAVYSGHGSATSGPVSSDAATAPSETVTLSGTTMGSMWKVTLAEPSATATQEALSAEIRELLARLDGQMSNYQASSELSRFNRAQSTQWFDVSPELAEVVGTAQHAAEESHGAFDITVAPLVNLWGFGPPELSAPRGSVPTPAAIDAARAAVDYRLLECRASPPALRKRRAEVTIDLGGIGKGFAADKIAAALDRHGITSYLIAVGGELRARGAAPHRACWHVGIETPTPDVRRILRQVDLRDASLSTSGDYRNFFERAGRRYCHEVDPRTGRPIDHQLASVSVIHRCGAYADAMATALMVLGPEEGFALARELKLSVLMIVRGEKSFMVRTTPEWPGGD